MPAKALRRGGNIMLTKLQFFTFLIVTAMAFAVPGWRPNSAFGQGLRIPELSPGVHDQRLQRPGEAAIRYAISIPSNYSPSAAVPLVLALHYGGDPNGAGKGVLSILVRPALAELGAIIVAPDSTGGGWSTPENERAVNTL